MPRVPIRIYALAKELKLDSKELVDICTKAGITGKGSALASLEDAEVDKLKSYLAGGDKKGDKKIAPADALLRHMYRGLVAMHAGQAEIGTRLAAVAGISKESSSGSQSSSSWPESAASLARIAKGTC